MLISPVQTSELLLSTVLNTDDESTFSAILGEACASLLLSVVTAIVPIVAVNFIKFCFNLTTFCSCI